VDAVMIRSKKVVLGRQKQAPHISPKGGTAKGQGERCWGGGARALGTENAYSVQQATELDRLEKYVTKSAGKAGGYLRGGGGGGSSGKSKMVSWLVREGGKFSYDNRDRTREEVGPLQEASRTATKKIRGTLMEGRGSS